MFNSVSNILLKTLLFFYLGFLSWSTNVIIYCKFLLFINYFIILYSIKIV